MHDIKVRVEGLLLDFVSYSIKNIHDLVLLLRFPRNMFKHVHVQTNNTPTVHWVSEVTNFNVTLVSYLQLLQSKTANEILDIFSPFFRRPLKLLAGLPFMKPRLSGE